MPDPFSIATGCVSVLGSLAAASKQISLFVGGVRDARLDMIAVSRELVSLQLCLVTLQNDSGKIIYPAGLEEHIKAVLMNCGLVVADIMKLLTNLEALNALQRIQWAVTGSTEMNKLRGSLEVHKSALEIALQLTTIMLVSELKGDTEVIIAQNEAIKQDTSQIAFLVDVVSRLHTQIADSGGHFLLQRFLNESASCAASIVGLVKYDNSADEGIISEEEAELDFSPQSVGAKSSVQASGGSLIVARRLRRFSFQTDSESSRTSEPLTQENDVPRSRKRPLSRSPSLEEELPILELPDAEPASSSSGTPLDQRVIASTRTTTRTIDYPRIKASKLARAALTPKQRIALDIRLRVAVQGISQGGKGFASFPFRLGNNVGTLQEIREILDAGADVRLLSTPGFAGLVDDKDRMNALDFEINNAKREDVVELLLSIGSSPNGLKIHTAIKRNDVNTLKRLLEYEANPQELDDYNRSALYWAAERDSEEMIAILLYHGAETQDSVGYENSEALEHACRLGNVNAVRTLLEARATTRYPGRGAPWNRKVQLKPEVIALIETHGGFKKRNTRGEKNSSRADR